MASESQVKGTTNGSDLSAAIALRAYYKAEQRGFEPGYELEDWLSAEQEILSVAARGAGGAARRKVSARKTPNTASKPEPKSKSKGKAKVQPAGN